MSQVYDLGAYRAIVKGVQEFFLQTQQDAHANLCCQHDIRHNVDISCKHDDTRSVTHAVTYMGKDEAMPPKGWKSGRPEGIVKAVRLSEDIIERIARYVECLQAQLPDDRINEGVALRRLIRIGLDTVEASMPQSIPQLQPTPPIQPAIPIALEPAPQQEAQPARKSKTPSSRGKGGILGSPLTRSNRLLIRLRSMTS